MTGEAQTGLATSARSHGRGVSERPLDGFVNLENCRLCNEATEFLTWCRGVAVGKEVRSAFDRTISTFASIAADKFEDCYLEMVGRYGQIRGPSMLMHDCDALNQLVEWYSKLAIEDKPFSSATMKRLGGLAVQLYKTIQGLIPLADEAEARGIRYRNDSEQKLHEVATPFLTRGRRIPPELAGRLSNARHETEQAWAEAKKQNDFKVVQPALKHLVGVTQEVARAIKEVYPHRTTLYGVLRSIYEPGQQSFGTKALFDKLLPHVKWLRNQVMQKLSASSATGTDSFAALQAKVTMPGEQAVLEVMAKVCQHQGLDMKRTLVCPTTRPFSFGINAPNVALLGMGSGINPFKAIPVAKHEAGHLLVYLEANETLWHTPFLRGRACISTGLDESLAKIHEICVGGGESFWHAQLGRMSETLPGSADIEAKDVAKALNGVSDTMLRIFADPMTYTIMIAIRYELERDLINGALQVEDLRDAWNRKHLEYFGREPKDDCEGVLQDIHWYIGEIGYFPSYTIGDLIAPQLYAAAKRDIPNLEEQIRAGNEIVLTHWLSDKVFPHVGILSAGEIVEQVTGKPLGAGDFLEFYAARYQELFGIEIPSKRPWQGIDQKVDV